MPGSSRPGGPGDRIWQVVYLAIIALACWLFGWRGWMVLPAVAIAVAGTFTLHFIVAFVSAVIRDTWPRGVPPELTEQYAVLKRDGWRLPRVHAWWKCGEARPHMHLVLPGAAAKQDLILVWDGITVLDEHGRILWEES